MNSIERYRLFTSSIEKAVMDNEETVIFDDPASGKFIQFAVFASEKTQIIDIPLNVLSKQEYEWLSQHLEVITGSNNEPISFQKSISTVQTDYAAQFVEWIFTKIFLLPDTYSIDAKVFT